MVRSASFPIDIHNPSGSGQAEGEGPQGRAARVNPYDIPYGCLVPRKIDGLLLAGRCISGSHDAHASYRVQCIAWCRENGIEFHAHGLGYAFRAGWPFYKLPVKTEEEQARVRQVYEQYVRDTVGHFKGRAFMWDVCNESGSPR